MRLGFVSARSGFYEPGCLWSDAGVGRLLEALRQRADTFTCALSATPARQAAHNHALEIEADRFAALPPLPGFLRAFHKVPACRQVIRQVEDASDVVIVQMPFIAPLALVGARKPRVYQVYGDVLKMAEVSSAYAGWRRRLAVGVARGIDGVQAHLFRQSQASVLTHGADMLDRYRPPRGRAVVSSTLYDREIQSVARSRPPEAPFRVLFVGYLRPEKGIGILIDAFETLTETIPDAELHLVGAQVPQKGAVADEVYEAVRRLEGRAALKFLGPRVFGPDLFECFAEADVLALPSLSEGTPRVLVEARAFGCPVVATEVGGVPSSVTHGVDGLLVPPGDPEALAAALLRVAEDTDLRRTLVHGGLARARRTTIEAMADTLYREAEAVRAQ